MLVLWPYALLQYTPFGDLLNFAYLAVILLRRLSCLVGDIGALLIFDFVAFHKYVIGLYFLSVPTTGWHKILAYLFNLSFFLVFCLLSLLFLGSFSPAFV
jgi:hypothetical protein